MKVQLPTTNFMSGQREENRLIAVGHRVVHGGHEFSHPTVINPEVLAKLERLVSLAPLHQPHNLLPIRLINQGRPELPQVACFDTSFHCAQEELAQAFALPPSISDRGVRRYGFHGLSYVEANNSGGPRISAESSCVSVWIIPTNEELMIALHSRRVIGAATVAA